MGYHEGVHFILKTLLPREKYFTDLNISVVCVVMREVFIDVKVRLYMIYHEKGKRRLCELSLD